MTEVIFFCSGNNLMYQLLRIIRPAGQIRQFLITCTQYFFLVAVSLLTCYTMSEGYLSDQLYILKGFKHRTKFFEIAFMDLMPTQYVDNDWTLSPNCVHA